MNDKFWMHQAYELALLAKQQEEVPVGAVLVSNNMVIGKGYNQVIQSNDPSAHAELIAIRDAANYLNNYRLLNSTLYVTLEPCAMCAGALLQARIERLVFATRDLKMGAAGSVCNLLLGHPFNHQVLIDEGLLQAQSANLLKTFFQTRRAVPL